MTDTKVEPVYVIVTHGPHAEFVEVENPQGESVRVPSEPYDAGPGFHRLGPLYPASAIEQMVERVAIREAGVPPDAVGKRQVQDWWESQPESYRETYRAHARRVLGLEETDE